MDDPRRFRRLVAVMLAAAAVCLLPGCGTRPNIEPRPGPVKGLLPAEVENRAEAVRRDPVAYLRKVAQRCRGLDQYTLTFTRYERRGLLQMLYGPEHITCWFRRQPFSIRMKWLDEDLKYGESVYVAGQGGNKVRFVTRWWTPPLTPPPGINTVDLQTPVIWGESKRPLTDFGLERLMERTLASIERAGDDVIVTYRDPLLLSDDGPTVHDIHLEYPAARYKVPVQDLYIDVATDLPAGTVLKLPSGDIDAAYFYADLDANVSLTDADFLLEAERKTPADGPTTSAPAK